MRFVWSIASLLLVVCVVIANSGILRPKRAYTMVDYICHKQPYLSICNQRSVRSSSPPQINNKINNPYEIDNDPMPTPGPLPLGELQSAYDVALRREQEEPKEEKVKEKKVLSKSPPIDSDLLNSAEKADRQSETTTINEEPITSTTPSTDETTQQSLNPRLRYQQYEKALQEYYRTYPNYQQTYSNQYPSNGYYSQSQNQYPQNGYSSQSQRQYYQPSQYTYQQQQPYYPQQTYYPQQSQPNYYQPNGFNFGIGSQLMIPYAGPIGISSGFGFSG